MIKRCYSIIVVVCLLALLNVQCANARSGRNEAARVVLVKDSVSNLSKALEEFADQMGNRLNGTMIIARNDTVLVERAFGYLQLFKDPTGYGDLSYNQLADLKAQESNKMTVDALFDLASVSKQFTAAAVLKLCSEGKMDLSDSLGKYYPKIPYSKVTIRQLLAHTSGIPEYFNFDFSIYDTSIFISNEQLMEVLAVQRFPVMFKRGTNFKYVNTNYAILAAIVAQVSEMSFEEYVRKNLWEPVGMTHTRFFTEVVGVSPKDFLHHAPVEKGQEYVDVFPMKGMTDVPVTRGHWKNGALAPYDRLNGILGDKGVFTNVEDLAKWTNAFYVRCAIIPKEWVDKAITCQNKLANGTIPAEQYGFGVRMERKDHGRVIYHGGLWDGYHNVWLYRPSDGLQIIFLSNYYNRGHIGKCDELLELIDKF